MYLWLTLSLAHLQRYEEAIEEMCDCLDAYPAFQQGLLLLADLHASLKHFKAAVEHIQAAIRVNPKAPECYLQLALCYSAMGEPQKQKELLQSML
jgi:tetratricopeptide (TPR) repeat protein